MAEYIDREEAKAWIAAWLREDKYWHPYSKGKNIPTPEVFATLSLIPAADVHPAKWIPTAEQLPERFDTVIVCGKMKYSFEKEYERFVDVACFDEPDKEKDQDRWATFNDWYEGQQEYEITHWMPLPEPPKDGET